MTSPPPLNILHLTGASDAGGLSRYLLDLSAGLLTRGHHVTIAGQRGAWHDRFTAANLPWIDLPLRGGPLSLRRAAAFLKDHLKNHPTDLIHTHYRKPTLVARRATANLKIPILYTVHQPRIRLVGPWRWLSDFGDHTHAPSQDARRWLIETAKIPDEKITVIPHGVDPALFPQRSAADKSAARMALGLPEDAVVAAFVGRLDVLKNAAWILSTACLFRELNSNRIFLIAGDGPEMPDLRRAIEREGLGNLVRLLGECPVLPVYQAADAFLSPSEREGFGLACAEAMCVGIPVLRTQTGGTEEMIVNKVTGWSVPVDRLNFMAGAAEFLAYPKLEEMGVAAAKHIRENLTLDRQIDQTIDLYRKCRVGVPAHH